MLIVGAAASEPERFAQRVVEEGRRSSRLRKSTRCLPDGSRRATRGRSREVFEATILKRLKTAQRVVVAIPRFDASEPERLVRLAHGQRRPRNLILIETSRDQVLEEKRPGLDELRRALDAGELGLDGF